MDTESLALNDVDIEEGQLSDTSEEGYTPLQRPSTLTHNIIVTATPTNSLTSDAKCTEMDADAAEEEEVNKSLNIFEDEDQSDDYISSSGDSSDTCLDKTKEDKKSKRRKSHCKRTVMVRIQPKADGVEQKKARFKKYDIWTAALQEDALTENMRGCDVTQNTFNDRNVENYDFSLKYRLNGENSLKRRLSNSNDDLSDSDQHQPHSKRRRPCSRSGAKETSFKRSVHERLGKRKDYCGLRRKSSNSGSSDSNSYEPKSIEDLEDVEGRDAIDVAKEMALKLFEEKDELLVKIVEILGTELPLKVYQETQRIEAEGGMTIKNGQRRRTPGGVFLFLLKHHDLLSAEDQKAIFAEDRNTANKKHKNMKASIRDRKVEELKKRLCEQGADLSNLGTRKEILLLGEGANQKPNAGNLSNPPPSPEAFEQNELALVPIPINHVSNNAAVNLSDKPSTSHGITDKNVLQAYEDDCLDVNYGDMDFF